MIIAIGRHIIIVYSYEINMKYTNKSDFNSYGLQKSFGNINTIATCTGLSAKYLFAKLSFIL